MNEKARTDTEAAYSTIAPAATGGVADHQHGVDAWSYGQQCDGDQIGCE